MIFRSVCSGIEAASVAWHPLGWRADAFAEVDAFPAAALAHHYPNTPNLGDMTKYRDWPDAKFDVLVGGTPCQSFSVAGLRKGLADPRGNLALVYLGILDRFRPRWMVWENVPGVLSSNDGRDFGAFLGGLAQLGYGFAYRVLDAQYVRVDGFSRAVPQRRRRVFVVGYLGDWRRAAAVLFERSCLSGDTAPRREAGQRFACDVVPRLVSRGRGVERPGETRGQDPVVAELVARTLQTTSNDYSRADGFNMVAHSLRGEGFDASEDGTGRGTPLVPICFSSKDHGADAIDDLAPTLRAMGHAQSHPNAGGQLAIAIQAGALRENPLSGPDGVGVQSDIAYTPEARAEVQAVAFDMRGRDGGSQFEGPHETANIRAASGGSSRSYVADTWRVRRLTPRECERLQGFPDDYSLVPYGRKVRAEKLDADFLKYLMRGNPKHLTREDLDRLAADGPRYKALGNSMAVNVMRWIGTRIQMVDDFKASEVA